MPRRRPAARPGLLLLGHTDVVPVGDGWTVDPFGGESCATDGSTAGARTDMKGGLAACVVAMTALRAGRRGPLRTGRAGRPVDEEEHGLGIRRFVAENGRGVPGCVVAEPTDLQTIVAARGDCYLDIVVHGSAAHAGRPATAATRSTVRRGRHRLAAAAGTTS